MSRRPPALVVVNRSSRGGNAPALYERVRASVRSLFDVEEVTLDREDRWRDSVVPALAGGIRTVLAAGGDGTVNAVASALLEARGRIPLGNFRLGAVGLGSSNDFHKPFRTVCHGIPLRIDADHASPRDVGLALFEDEDGSLQSRIFLVSASLGVTAAANAFFERGGDRLLTSIKPRWPSAAIVYAALRTILRHSSVPATLQIGEARHRLELSNLSVGKTPYLAGFLHYDTPVEPASGRLSVNLCEAMSRSRLIWTFLRLARGRFAGAPGTQHRSIERIGVVLDSAAPLELDGEIFSARHVEFDLLPERLPVCA